MLQRDAILVQRLEKLSTCIHYHVHGIHELLKGKTGILTIDEPDKTQFYVFYKNLSTESSNEIQLNDFDPNKDVLNIVNLSYDRS